MPFRHFSPQIFTFLFFVILIYVLKTGKLFFIPLLFLFWENIHSGFVAVLVYFYRNITTQKNWRKIYSGTANVLYKIR